MAYFLVLETQNLAVQSTSFQILDINAQQQLQPSVGRKQNPGVHVLYTSAI